MVFEENFMSLTATVRLQKNESLKNMNFLIHMFQSISCNNVDDAKQIYFLHTSWVKLWVHISNNAAVVVEGPQYY